MSLDNHNGYPVDPVQHTSSTAVVEVDPGAQGTARHLTYNESCVITKIL